MRLSILAAALALAACAQAPEAAPPARGDASALVATRWVMVRADDSPQDRAPPTIEFSETGAAGFAGCNRWFAQVAHNGEALAFSAIGATRMACPPDAMAVERAFLQSLERTRYGHYDADALVLLDEAQEQLSRFERFVE